MESMSSRKKGRLFLIDAYGFVFRAYHSLPPLTSPDNTPVGAVYGFTNMILKLKSRTKPEDGHHHMLVVFDSGRKTFRNDIYQEYKANRPPAPEDLVPQFPIIREAAEALGLPSISSDGYEADDIIATYVGIAKEKGFDVTIVSSDKDLMQLVGGNIEMFDAMKDKKIGPEEVKEKFGVFPDKVLDVLALMGDSSDNIPGVPGIGPKTASELINEYGSLDNLLSHVDEIKQNKRRETIKQHKEDALISRQLASLYDKVPVSDDLEKFNVYEPDKEKLFEFLNKYGFKSLVARLSKQMGEIGNVKEQAINVTKKTDKKDFLVIRNKSDLTKWLEKAGSSGKLVVYPDFSQEKSLTGIVLAASISDACYIELGQQKIQATFDFGTSESTTDVYMEELRGYFENSAILKIGCDIKELLKHHDMEPIDDVLLLSYVLDGAKNKYGLRELIKEHFGADITEGNSPHNRCTLVCYIFQLHEYFRRRLFNERLNVVYETIERPLIKVLASMEKTGVKVDIMVLRKLSGEFASYLVKLEKEIYSLTGHEFNIASPKQLGEVLFEEMNIAGGKKTKTGSYSTGADILEELSAQGHIIAQKVLEWREFSKLKSTYTDALTEQINASTGRIHTTFAMTVASTGRLSSINPNLQNIPIRSEYGRKIRNAFVAEKGMKIISADYSQIELRLLAHFADIPTMKQAFKEGKDIHAITASQVFGVPLDKVDSQLRRNAKTINFGIIYGQSAFGLAAQLGIGRREAASYIDVYFKQYPGIKNYMEKAKEYAREHGFVETIYGRKCYLEGIKDKNPSIRGFAERAAINAPLQGTAADIIKKAMINIHRQLVDIYPKTKMILQIHDELLFETPENDAEEIGRLVKKEMEGIVRLSIPIVAEVKIGTHWGEVH